MTDAESRKKIVSEIDRSFFVEAGAGSGKTTMLVNRMVALVESGVEIDKISAITFTKAAANEFYERFRNILSARSRGEYDDSGRPGSLGKPSDKAMERCFYALNSIDLCFMGTIDSFCQTILTEHPVEAGVPSDAKIVSDQEASAFIRPYYINICNGVYGDELKVAAASFNSFYDDPESVFMSGLSLLMNNRNVEFELPDIEHSDIEREYVNVLREARRALNFLRDHKDEVANITADNSSSWDRIDMLIRKLGYNAGKYPGAVLSALKNMKKMTLRKDGFSAYEDELGGAYEIAPRARTAKVSEGINELIEVLNDLKYDITMKFLSACVPMISEALRLKGYLSYFDNLYYLREMLRKDAAGGGDLIRYIRQRHSIFLIDEFQDTDPLQAEIFYYLSTDDPVEDWTRCVPIPGSLFIVGDPKQSIYRFRSADVSSFEFVKSLFAANGDEILKLPNNFRSTGDLCSYFNDMFEAAMPESDGNNIKFEPIPEKDRAPEGDLSGVFKFDVEVKRKGFDPAPEKCDHVQIRKIIETLVDNDAYLINGRRITYGDFMVITSGKKALEPIKLDLDDHGIPTRVEGSVPFGINDILKEIYNIYAFLSDTNDRASLYGALTGKILGMTKEEIMTRALSEKGLTIFIKEGEEDDTRLCRALLELRDLYYKTRDLTPASVYEKIFESERVLEHVGAKGLEVSCFTLELMRAAEKDGRIVTAVDGRKFLEELMFGTPDQERCLALSENGNTVHLANLHKVKGLEKPIVIIASAQNRGASFDKRIVRHGGKTTGYIFSVSDNGNSDYAFPVVSTSRFEEEKDAEKASYQAESIRLQYVGATRAANVLIIGIRNGNKWSSITSDDLTDIFEACPYEPRPVPERPNANASELYDKAEGESSLWLLEDMRPTYKEILPSKLKVSSRTSDRRLEPELTESDDAIPAYRYPDLLGTMIHRLMEALVTSGGRFDPVLSIAEIVNEFMPFEDKAVADSIKVVLLDVYTNITTGGFVQENDVPRDILTTLLEADEVHCETPFCYMDDDSSIVSGVMDVIYREGQDWHIIDYKTNADGKDLDTRYEGQLNAYKRAFNRMTGLAADARIYHIDK